MKTFAKIAGAVLAVSLLLALFGPRDPASVATQKCLETARVGDHEFYAGSPQQRADCLADVSRRMDAGEFK